MIETEDGKVFELDSHKGSAWLESIKSFRFEPSGDSKPYTVRLEASAYWYGCRKVAGKVRKKYIGKSSSLSVAKLEEIAEALEILPVSRANKVTEVAEVAEKVTEVAEVAEKVTEVAEDRLTALELQVANLQKAVEVLQKALSGKLESSDFLELPKVDNEVAEQLQNELGNLKDENEALRQELAKEKENYGALTIISQQLNQQLEEVKADRAKILESSTHVTNKLRQEVQELRSQLETERASREETEAELFELKQNPAPAATVSEKLIPDAATILSQLRAKRKKTKTDLADLEAILELLQG
jgi:chromosome segregation ATPase